MPGAYAAAAQPLGSLMGLNQSVPDPHDLNRDLYCLGCGYNLRGLGGDPRRCPECGKLNTVAELEVPAAQIKKALRRLETGPALTTGSLVALLFWLLPTLSVVMAPLQGYSGPSDPILVGLISLIALAAIGGSVGVVLFRSSCMAKPGWTRALATFSLYGTLVALCGLGAMAALFWVIVVLARSWPNVSVSELGAGAVFAAACGFAVRWCNRRAKAAVAPPAAGVCGFLGP